MRVLGIYREAQFSPGKVAADASIMDAVLSELRKVDFQVTTSDPARVRVESPPDLVLAMCQGQDALRTLAALEEAGAVVINSALAIRNCYRDLLGVGLARARVPSPPGALIDTSAPSARWQVQDLDPSGGLYVKRGDLHALEAGDVCRVEGRDALERAIAEFARRGVRHVYVQQAVTGRVVKFYGVGGGEYFATVTERGDLSDTAERTLRQCAERAANALGLEAWGGDALVDGDRVTIVDFNDWPSYSAVRGDAARAIARRCLILLRRAQRIGAAPMAAADRYEDDDF